MGIASKLGQKNAQASSHSKSALTPLSEGGYNCNNVPTLQSTPPMTQGELQDIREVKMKTQLGYQNREQNMYGLVKPYVPQGPEYPDIETSMLVVEKMWRIVCLRELHAFYTQERLQEYVNRACKHDYRALKREWEIPSVDAAVDLAVLGLYDIVILADDSTSMSWDDENENIPRWEVLKEILKTIGFWSTLMDPDGVVVRFLNKKIGADGNGLRGLNDVQSLFSKCRPNGGTPLGRAIKNEIYENIVAKQLKNNELERPVLLMTITDGSPNNEDNVFRAIIDIVNDFGKSKYGKYGMAFSFSQVGNDTGAESFLDKLDMHSKVGKMVDCTSNYTMESKQVGPLYTPTFHIIKTMIGAIDPDYDEADEKGNQYNKHPQHQQQYQQPYQQYQPPVKEKKGFMSSFRKRLGKFKNNRK